MRRYVHRSIGCRSLKTSQPKRAAASSPLTLRAALAVLGLSPKTLRGREFSHKDLKKAYISQTLNCHPDLFPEDKEAHTRFQQLQDALAIATRSLAGGEGGAAGMGDDGDATSPMALAEQLKTVMERHKALREELENVTAAPHQTHSFTSADNTNSSGGDAVDIGEVVAVCTKEAEGLATINRFRTTLAKTLSGETFTLFDTFVLYHPQYVRAMAKCALRFSRDLPIIVRRVVTHRRRHIAVGALQKGTGIRNADKAQRFRQGIAPHRGVGSALASSSSSSSLTSDSVDRSARPGGTSDTIDAMPMKPLVLVGALVFAHPKLTCTSSSGDTNNTVNSSTADADSSTNNTTNVNESMPRAHGPHSLSDIQCAPELVCVIHPNDNIDSIVHKIGAWEGRSFERLRVELAMVQSARTLSHLLGMVSVPFGVHHQLYRSTDDTVLASLTMQRLVCLLSGLVGPDVSLDDLRRANANAASAEGEGGGDEETFFAGLDDDEDGGERVIRSMLAEIAMAQADGSLFEALGGDFGGGQKPQLTLHWRPPEKEVASNPSNNKPEGGVGDGNATSTHADHASAGTGGGVGTKEESTKKVSKEKEECPPLVRSMEEFLPDEELLSETYHDMTAREIAHEHAYIGYRRRQQRRGSAAASQNLAKVGHDGDEGTPPTNKNTGNDDNASAQQGDASNTHQNTSSSSSSSFTSDVPIFEIGFMGTPKAFLEGGEFRNYGSVTRDHAACDPTFIRFTAGVELHKNPIRFLRSIVIVQRELLARAKASRDALGPIVDLRKKIENEEFIPKSKEEVGDSEEVSSFAAATSGTATAHTHTTEATPSTSEIHDEHFSGRGEGGGGEDATAPAAPTNDQKKSNLKSADTTTSVCESSGNDSAPYFGSVEGDVEELYTPAPDTCNHHDADNVSDEFSNFGKKKDGRSDGELSDSDEKTKGGGASERVHARRGGFAMNEGLSLNQFELPTPFTMPAVDHPTVGNSKSIFFKSAATKSTSATDSDASDSAAALAASMRESAQPTFGSYSDHYLSSSARGGEGGADGDGELLSHDEAMERIETQRLRFAAKQIEALGLSEDAADVLVEGTLPKDTHKWSRGGASKTYDESERGAAEGHELSRGSPAFSHDGAGLKTRKQMREEEMAKLYEEEVKRVQWGRDASPDFVRYHPGTDNSAYFDENGMACRRGQAGPTATMEKTTEQACENPSIETEEEAPTLKSKGNSNGNTRSSRGSQSSRVGHGVKGGKGAVHVEYVHRPSIRLISRTYGMEGPTELLFWQRLFEHREQLAKLAPSMSPLNVHFGRVDDGNPRSAVINKRRQQHDKGGSAAEGEEEEEVGGWYGESSDGDKAIVTKAILNDSYLFGLWLQDVSEQSGMAREAARALKRHGIEYVSRDPRLPLTQYLSFVKVFCSAEAARAQLEMRARGGGPPLSQQAPLTSDAIGFSIVVVSGEASIRDGGVLCIPWYADPATLVTLLTEPSLTLSLA